MSWRKNRSISPIFLGEPTLCWENLPYHIDAKEEESDLNHNSGKCPYELRKLIFIEQLFIKKVPTSLSFTGLLSRRKSYKITDHTGVVIFHVVKFIDFCAKLKDKFPIQYNFYTEPERTLVLTIRGNRGGGFGIGAKMSVKLIRSNGASYLGEICQEKFWDPIFSLMDSNGKCNFSIQGPEEGNCWGVTNDAEFNVCQHAEEDVQVIGKLQRNHVVQTSDFTKSIGDNLDIGTRCKWSLEFPRRLDPSLKALIVSGLFLMESQYYQ